MQELLGSSALELARLIRERQVSAREVVDLHIFRIEAVNPIINAVVAERFDAARTEADRADAIRQRDAFPLLGVPFTAKEMIEVEGMPSTYGCTTRKALVAKRDATAVQRLRAAGAIPLGVTNVPEWGMWYETDNLVYGLTRNPHNLEHTAGGSSGGEAAIIGAGGSPFGLGSDIGGSIRIPAAFCGVYGHKPSNGLVPLTGHYPVFPDDDPPVKQRINPYVVIGPLTRRAEDLMPVLRIIAGYDPIDPNSIALPLRDPHVDWRGRRVFVLENPGILLAGAPTPAVSAAILRAANTFADHGAFIERFPASLFEDAVDLWGAALQSIGTPGMAELIAPVRDGVSQQLSLVRELFRAVTGGRNHTWPVLGFCAFERLTRKSEGALRQALDHIDALTRRFHTIVGEDAILIMPPHPRTAPRHHTPLLHPFSFGYTAALNVLRVPAAVAPIGFDADRLPLSVQIAASFGQDQLCLAAATLLEQSSGTPGHPAINVVPQAPQTTTV